MNFLPPPNQPINLLRSIAKVRVELSEDLKKFVEVTPYQPGNANTGCVLNYKHAVGYLAPLYSYYQTRTDVQSNLYQDRVGGSSTGAFTNEYIHQFANAQKDQTGHAPFFKDENGAFYIYMYEHQINEANISMQFHWTADALQKDPVYHTYTLHFADYEAATQAAKNKVGAANWKERPLTDEELQPYKFPVMRNHYYTYTITKLNPLELKYEVCDWINKPDIDIVFGEVGVSSITLDPTTATLKVDETINLTATVLPSAATNKSLTWTSSNPDVATVSEDPVSRAASNSTVTVTAKASGTAIITATANDGSGATASCTVTVTKPVESISISPTSATVEVGKTVELTATVSPDNATDNTVTWSSNSTGIATVSEAGVVTGVAPGTATITATAADGSGVTETCTVTVKSPLPDGALPGEFSVNSSGKKVYFSKGNLRATYNGTNYTWGFAANQYDYIGNAKGNTSIDAQSNNAVVDLFGWSTSATNYGINTSKSNSTYSGNFNDWGKNIGDGNTWRTLSNEEWKYLFETRTVRGSKGVNYSYSKHITYGGRKGWVLYPDNYTGNTLSTSANYSSLPEGVVFLPYAGRRLSNVGDVGNYGYYWTSTLNGSGTAYHFSINTNNLYWNSTNRYNGDSVRLVADKK